MKLTPAQLAGVAFAAAIASTLTAETRVNDNFSVYGYVVGSVQGYDYSDDYSSSDDSSWTMDMDAILIGARATFDNVSGVVSLYARSDNYFLWHWTGNGTDPDILDAYVVYDAGDGVAVTMGNFQSSLGYEPFHIIGSNAITAGADAFRDLIPAYSTGVKVAVTRGAWTGGIAVKDSIRNGDEYAKGDGELDQGAGAEAFVKYQQDALTAFLGLAYDNGADYDNLTADLWAQYVIRVTTLAAEFCYADGGILSGEDGDAYFWLVSAKQAMGDWAVAARVSGGNWDWNYGEEIITIDESLAYIDQYGQLLTYSMLDEFDEEFLKGTIAVTYAVTQNLEIVAEYSCIDVSCEVTRIARLSDAVEFRQAYMLEDSIRHFGGVQFRFHY